MPSVEIDEVELLRLRKQDTTVHKLLADPKAKKKLFEAHKIALPEVRIPELEAEEAVKAPVDELAKQFADLSKKIDDQNAEREKNSKLLSLTNSIEAGKAKLRREGWTDEGILAVEKVMEEKGTTDIEVAAAYYEKLHPPALPANPRGQGGWNFVENVADAEKDLKALVESKGQNDMLSDKMAREVLNDIRGASRR